MMTKMMIQRRVGIETNIFEIDELRLFSMYAKPVTEVHVAVICLTSNRALNTGDENKEAKFIEIYVCILFLFHPTDEN